MMWLAVLFSLGLVVPITGHNPEEYETWFQEWEAAYDPAGPLAHEMELALEDFHERHPDGPTVVVEPVRSPPIARALPPEESVTEEVVSAPPEEVVSGGAEAWRSLVAAYFPADQVDFALKVLQCESKGNPNAKNPYSTAAGLFQFLQSTWDDMVPLEVTGGSYASGQVYDPTANVRSAAWLLAAEGWGQWSCAGKV